mgnify:CR=1 FL=1
MGRPLGPTVAVHQIAPTYPSARYRAVDRRNQAWSAPSGHLRNRPPRGPRSERAHQRPRRQRHRRRDLPPPRRGRFLRTGPPSLARRAHPQGGLVEAAAPRSSAGKEIGMQYVVPDFAYARGSTGTQARFRQLSKPRSANWTPLAPSSRFHLNGSSFTTWRRNSSHCALKAFS